MGASVQDRSGSVALPRTKVVLARLTRVRAEGAAARRAERTAGVRRVEFMIVVDATRLNCGFDRRNGEEADDRGGVRECLSNVVAHSLRHSELRASALLAGQSPANQGSVLWSLRSKPASHPQCEC